MTDAERIERIKKVLSAILGIEPEAIGEDFSSDSTEQWDSLRHINLIIALEQEFKISFPDEDVAMLSSLRLLNLAVHEALGKD